MIIFRIFEKPLNTRGLLPLVRHGCIVYSIAIAILLIIGAGGRLAAESITNGTFETTGFYGWTGSGSFYQWSNSARAHGGSGYAYFGVGSDGVTAVNNANGTLTQSFIVPQGPLLTLMDFYLWTASDEGSTPANDYLYVDVLNSSGTLLATIATYSDKDKAGAFSTTNPAYQLKPLSLRNYMGGSVKLRFRGSTNASKATLFRLDDVSLVTTSLYGNVQMTVNSSSGSALNVSDINAVLLFQSTGNGSMTRMQPPAANPMSFTDIPYGNYYMKAFCWDMLTATTNTFTLGSGALGQTVQSNPKRPLNISLLYDDGTTPISGATVMLDSLNGETGILTNRLSGSTNASGNISFSAYPTTQQGEQYSIRILIGGTLVQTIGPVTVTNSASGSSCIYTTTIQVPTGTIRASILDSSNSLLSTSEMNAVLLYKTTTSGAVASKSPVKNNPMDFTGMVYGNYRVDAFCWDMLAARSGTFTHQSTTTTISINTNIKRPLSVKVYYNDGKTPFSGANVELSSFNGQTSAWTPRATSTTDSNGSFAVLAWPTTQSGEKYRIGVTAGGNTVGSIDSLAVPVSPTGTALSITTNVPPPPIVTLTSLNGGDSLRVGNGYTIGANVFGLINSVSFSISYDGGNIWNDLRTILTNSPLLNTYWVPDTATSTARIRVTVTSANGTASTTSESNITINPVPVPVSSDTTLQNIPVYRQTDSPWGSQQYDHQTDAKTTIADVGCAMTTIAMSLGYEHLQMNPLDLNKFMNDNNDYTANGGVKWEDTVKDVSGGTLQFVRRNPYLSSTNGLAVANAYLDEIVCTKRYPAIVGVDGDKHYVLVTGKISGRFTIIDPYYPERDRLDVYPNFSARGYIAPVSASNAVSSLAALNAAWVTQAMTFCASANASLVVTDPIGNQTGNPGGGNTYVEQIPDSSYMTDTNANPADSTAPRITSHTVFVAAPSDGLYHLGVNSINSGPFDLTVIPPFVDAFKAPIVILGNTVAEYFTLDTTTQTNITVTTSVSKTRIVTGEPVVVTVVVTNSGPDPAQLVTVTDELPSGMAISSATPSSGAMREQGGIITWAVGDLLPLASGTLTYTATSNVAGLRTYRVITGVFTHETDISDNTAINGLTVLTPYQQWQSDSFGDSANDDSIAGNTADPDHDGVPNLIEYAVGSNPLMSGLFQPFIIDSGSGYLTITVSKNPSAVDLTMTAEISGDLTDPSSWSSDRTVILQNDEAIFKARDSVPLTDARTRFIRLKVSRH